MTPEPEVPGLTPVFFFLPPLLVLCDVFSDGFLGLVQDRRFSFCGPVQLVVFHGAIQPNVFCVLLTNPSGIPIMLGAEMHQ